MVEGGVGKGKSCQVQLSSNNGLTFELVACLGHTALDKPVLYGVLPITKTVAAALGAVIALLLVVIVGLAVGWRLSVTSSRKSYKKWNEEVRAAALLATHFTCCSLDAVEFRMDERVLGSSLLCPQLTQAFALHLSNSSLNEFNLFCWGCACPSCACRAMTQRHD